MAAKKKKRDFAALGNRTRESSERLAQQDRALEEERTKEKYRLNTLKIGQIQERANPDTRALKPQLVLELLRSIHKVGLIEPLAVDERHRLLAGGHRLTALRMLSEGKEEALRRFEALNPSPKQDEELQALLGELKGQISTDVPVHVFAFDSKTDPDRAFMIEAAENAVRRDYTDREVLSLYERMKDMEGFTTREGRPRAGERPVLPALAAVLGKSLSTVSRTLKRAQEEESEPKQARLKKAKKAVGRLRRAFDALKRDVQGVEGVEELAALVELAQDRDVVRALSKADEVLAAALSESGENSGV